ncbi:MAG: HEAT repeat domain-containing protein [Deltaproteobacteria bacterium]|nr:HEAT repeat domain-containing protein [Deltaproteobacteria bacterium]
MKTRRRWLGPLLLLAALAPAAIVAVQTAAIGTGQAEDEGLSEPERARRRLLRSIPSDASVLINVPYRDLPSSPELVNLGKRSTRALERCLADNVEVDARARCAIVLEALGDRRALGTLQTALADWEPAVRFRVVKALEAMPDPSSVAPLIKLFERKDEEVFIRTEIVRALGTISDKRVVTQLRKVLAEKPDAGLDLRPVAFESLWTQRHLMNRNTLIADVASALKSDNTELVLAATFAAAELRAPKLTSALVPLMESPNAEIANKAIYALGHIGDKTATKALLARLPEVRESRMLNNLAFALERLDKNAFYAEIGKTIEHKQAVIRLNSAFVLGDVAHASGLPLLQQALGDASDFVRTSAVAAMGKLTLEGSARDAALAALTPLADAANLSLKEEAIYALHALTPGGRADLVHDRLYAGLDPSRHGASIRRAALALGKAGDGRVREYLLRCVLSYGCDVDPLAGTFTKVPRSADTGRILLAWTRGQRRLGDWLSVLRPAGASSLAASILRDSWALPASTDSIDALRLLGGLGDTGATDLVLQRSTTTEVKARLASLIAAGRLGHAPAGASVVAELDNLAAESLPDAVRALTDVVEPGFRGVLDPLLVERTKSATPELAMGAAAVRLAWQPDAGFMRFLEALSSSNAQERELGEYYLKRNKDERITWAMRRALAREERKDVRDRLRVLLDDRG